MTEATITDSSEYSRWFSAAMAELCQQENLSRTGMLERELRKMAFWEQEVREVRAALERDSQTNVFAEAYANLYTRNAALHKKSREAELTKEKEKATDRANSAKERPQTKWHEEESAAKYSSWQSRYEEVKREAESARAKTNAWKEENNNNHGPSSGSYSAGSAWTGHEYKPGSVPGSGPQDGEKDFGFDRAQWEREWQQEYERKKARQAEAEFNAEFDDVNYDNPWEQQWAEFEANRKRREENMKRDDYKWYNTKVPRGTIPGIYSWYDKHSNSSHRGSQSGRSSSAEYAKYQQSRASAANFTGTRYAPTESAVDRHDAEWAKFEAWASTTEEPIAMINIPFLAADLLRQENRNTFFGYGLSRQERKACLRRLVIRWHPDKFLQKFGKQITEDDKENIIDRVTTMSQALNLLDETF
eukprot:CAMPEP_0197868214 /NCGR_PEP_ID=MMETSP1438-20131217/45165_1 /TAXON_ID=1461541 /ORGANISM="Pterosperma sp., Strain CCMP1384" /LENGTH=416 /DNA_ID=CAMNT_0043486905 /DNA_START=10 /DNA_END=1261 /DNA_ORIENTATION=+